MNRESYQLPAVLSSDDKRRESAISVMRALKNARETIEELLPEGEVPGRAQVALDDLELMIRQTMG